MGETRAVRDQHSDAMRSKDGGLPIVVMYGEKNFGRYSSATLLEQSVRVVQLARASILKFEREQGFKIEWVAKGGHSMHKDEGINLYLNVGTSLHGRL